MKKKILYLIGVIFLATGCEKNFDPQLYGTLNVSNYPKTKAEYESFMMTCYMPFTTTWTYYIGAGTTGNQHSWYIPAGGVLKLFDYPTEEMAIWNNGWGGEYLRLSRADFSQAVYYVRGTLDDARPNHFPKLAEVTYFTNVIGTLDKASTSIMSEDDKMKLLAEARLCRGLMMYYLLHVYGPVPVIVDPDLVTDKVALENLERPTMAQMSQWIMDDFDFAYQYIAETQKDIGRYNKDYTRVCIMRHCLNEGYHQQGYYAKALKMYQELKGKYNLYSKGTNPYTEVFKNANNFNEEIIMAVSADESADGGNKSGNFNPLMMLAVPDNAARVDDQGKPTAFALQGAGWGQTFNVSPRFYDTFEPNDLRKEAIITRYYTTAGKWIDRNNPIWDGFILNKFPIETATPFQGTDIPLARWADVLLMYAEADVRESNGIPSAEAIAAVNLVRKRAGLSNLPEQARSNKESFLDAILTERGHELYYEGLRKIDLIRFNKFAQRNFQLKGVIPTHQYLPIPNYAVQQAKESYGKNLVQTFEREGWRSDVANAR
ncbi:RagB/SusD family nutrient uptake outer membrane protein [Sphingobacterium sp. SYP-B4668]|uniref:RagB/SusD family nutrient uptake outer membrane protein n=1 Tax=Sphingobacterium sp. SYP-B4668 TaxID=2996035 RepID=UPI0022DE66B6|nr:RagB/SusD family nutrient uptake outer membrane protein [Sphingobacterium sp. SYP-B4668]